MVEKLLLEQDLVDHLLRAPGHQVAAQVKPGIELGARQRRPAALAPDPAHHGGVRREEGVGGGFRIVGDEAVRIDADLQGIGSVPGAPAGLAIEIDQRRESLRLAANDGERQRQAEGAGARHGLRRAADRDPDGQLTLGAGIDAEIVDGRAVAAAPAHAFILADAQQQFEVLGEQRVVVVQVLAEQRERFDEGAAPGHDLGAPARQQVDGGELLEHPHRIVGTQHRHRAGQLDAPGDGGGGGEDDGGRRDREVRPVMLADAEHIEPDLVGEADLFHQLGEALGGRVLRPGLREGVDADFHGDHSICRRS